MVSCNTPAGGQLTCNPRFSCVAEKRPLNSSIFVFKPLHLQSNKSFINLSTENTRIELLCPVFLNSVFLTSFLSGPGQES